MGKEGYKEIKNLFGPRVKVSPELEEGEEARIVEIHYSNGRAGDWHSPAAQLILNTLDKGGVLHRDGQEANDVTGLHLKLLSHSESDSIRNITKNGIPMSTHLTSLIFEDLGMTAPRS